MFWNNWMNLDWRSPFSKQLHTSLLRRGTRGYLLHRMLTMANGIFCNIKMWAEGLQNISIYLLSVFVDLPFKSNWRRGWTICNWVPGQWWSAMIAGNQLNDALEIAKQHEAEIFASALSWGKNILINQSHSQIDHGGQGVNNGKNHITWCFVYLSNKLCTEISSITKQS